MTKEGTCALAKVIGKQHMPAERVDVLLVGDNARNASSLHEHLKRHGCFLCYATSCKQAVELFNTRAFDLVLSEFMLSDGTAYQLMPLLRGTETTMFFSNAVEDSCWWMNAILRGEDRSHDPGMRPREFRVVLDQILHDKLFRAQNNLPTYQGKNAQADFETIDRCGTHSHASSSRVHMLSAAQRHAKS